MKIDNEIYIETIEEIIEGLGLKLVSYKIIKGKKSTKVAIDIHKPKGYISHNDCKLVIKNCGPFLNEKFGDEVELEVSSPGINRILKTERELKVFKDYDIEVYFKEDFLENAKKNNKTHLINGGVFILSDYRENNLYLIPKNPDSDNRNIDENNNEEIVNINSITKIKLLN